MRPLALLAICTACALALVACGSDGGEDENEPTFAQAEAIAKQQLAGSECDFKVEDESSDGLEQKGLDCYLTEGGEETYSAVFTYTRDLEAEESEALFGGVTTADHYFVNGNIEVDPAGGNPDAVQLDAERFATALAEECGCGEVLEPQQ